MFFRPSSSDNHAANVRHVVSLARGCVKTVTTATRAQHWWTSPSSCLWNRQCHFVSSVFFYAICSRHDLVCTDWQSGAFCIPGSWFSQGHIGEMFQPSKRDKVWIRHWGIHKVVRVTMWLGLITYGYVFLFNTWHITAPPHLMESGIVYSTRHVT